MPITFKKPMTLGALAELAGATCEGDLQYEILGVNTLKDATKTDISFLANTQYLSDLRETKAGAVIVSPAYRARCTTQALVTPTPYAAFAKVAMLCHKMYSSEKRGHHESACIASTAVIDKTAWIGPQVVIGEHVRIGAGVVISAGSVISDNVSVGANTYLYPNVTICEGVSVGQRVILHSGVVLGSEGFGFAFENGVWQKVPQLGAVCIGNDVEIGANTTVDRGTLSDTRIDEGVKIDNQVQIAHNVVIGAHTVIAGCTGIAGSTTIGRYCMIGGATCIAGHLTIGDRVNFAGMTAVSESISKPGNYASSTLVMEMGVWRRVMVHFKQLHHLVKRVKKLEEVNK